MSTRRIPTILALLCLALAAPLALADGNEILDTPSIDIAEGSRLLAAGTGMFDQPGTIDLDVPSGATVVQVLLYWQGRGTPDDTVTLNGTESVTGALIGATSGLSANESYAYRQDITSLGLIGPGANSVTVSDMDFPAKNDGAALLVIIDEGVGVAGIDIRDGMDFAFINEDPPAFETILQTFSFPDAGVDRQGSLTILVGDGTEGRPDEFELTVGGVTQLLTNEARGRDGEEWDTAILDFTIPAGSTSVGIQLFSRDTQGAGGVPDSLSWVAAAFQQPCAGTIGDFVWNDLDMNGRQDAGEPGIAGVELMLTTPGNNVFTTTTDADGFYEFTGLCAGTYTVEVNESTLPPELVRTDCEVAGSTSADDSNCQPAQVVLPEDFSDDPTIDFGYFSPCAGNIGDFVWNDLDRDGIQDAGEPGIPGVAVRLYDADMNPLASTTTDENGFYEFTGLCAGNYKVDRDAPDGYDASPCEQGADPTVDSNCNPAMVMLPEDNSTDLTIDFGFFMPAGGEGCTPGYWKQRQHFDSWTPPYTPDTLFSDVFEDAFPGKTLRQVLKLKGGGLKALGRHTVAALLNAASGGVEFAYSTDEVIQKFNAVYPGIKSDYTALKNDFQDQNDPTVCPLN